MAYNLRTLSSYQCTNHPDREGIGVCIKCRRVFCAECSTKIDGINYCNSCLTQLSLSAKEERPKTLRILQAAFAYCFVAIIFILLVSVGVCIGLVVPGMRHVKIEAKAAKNLQRLEEVRTALKDFYRDTGRYPTEKEGLSVLVAEDPNNDGNKIGGWDGPYILKGMEIDEEDNPFLDIYGAPIEYVVTKSGNRLIASRGADGEWSSTLSDLIPPNDKGEGDDVVMWVDR